MSRLPQLAIVALLFSASVACGDAVLLTDGTLLKGTIDYQTDRQVVLAITSYTKVPISRTDIGLWVVSDDCCTYARYSDGRSAADKGLQIAVALFKHPRTHKVVSLVGAIHVGDASYYRELRSILDAHDRVLYELVTGENTDGFSEVYGELTDTMRHLLQLESQKTIVNYKRPPKNWVHADLSWDQMKRKLKVDRLELIPDEVRKEMKTVAGLIDKYSKFADVVGLSGATAALLKRFVAREMGDNPEEIMAHIGRLKSGKAPRSLMGRLMRLRERWAIKVLKRELRRRKHDSFALFYGAGHMPYFEMRLKKMGFKKLGVAWVTAWKVP